MNSLKKVFYSLVFVVLTAQCGTSDNNVQQSNSSLDAYGVNKPCNQVSFPQPSECCRLNTGWPYYTCSIQTDKFNCRLAGIGLSPWHKWPTTCK
ncbi:MAG: hypothetical protein KBD78_09735 [Oligoflexales bacterium]|nr:hypothetical protein [Oligoflexales bacterium]